MIIEHIRHAVLRAAEDKSYNAQEDCGIFGKFMLVVPVAVYRNKDEYVTEDAQQEQTEHAVIVFDFAD